MNKNLITLFAAALAAATMLTACGSTTEPAAAPSSGAGSTPASSADEALRRVALYGAERTERMDRAAARAALESGRPFLVGLPDGSAEACHSALLLPDDHRVWILNESAVRPAGSALMEDRLQTYGCSAGEAIPPAPIQTPAPATAMDEAAADRAKAQARPFIYAIPSGGVTACNVAVRTPYGATWFLNRSGSAPAEGVVLSDVQQLYGCRTDPSR